MIASCVYFGCLGSLGHFFFTSGGASHMDGRRADPRMPEAWDRLADGQLLRNGKKPEVHDGRVYATAATDNRIAFFWWDRSVDHRPASNSAFFVFGFAWEDRLQAFEFACKQWPAVVNRQPVPLQLVD